MKKYYLNPAEESNMRISDDILKCVAFIGIEQEKNGKKYISYSGTCFFVEIEQQQTQFTYIVTANHIVKKITGRKYAIRLNDKTGNGRVIISNGNSQWFFHPTDTSVDAAVLEVDFMMSEFDYKAIATDMFVTDKKIKETNMGIGDEVSMIGLFTNFSGKEKNIPIIRIGNLAMLPDEKVDLKHYGHAEVYLIEARSRGGMSGSPVFVLPQQRNLYDTSYFLGLAHGHFPVLRESEQDFDDTTKTIVEEMNTGIGIVVPADKIYEILSQQALVDMRQKFINDRLNKGKPTPDFTSENGICL